MSSIWGKSYEPNIYFVCFDQNGAFGSVLPNSELMLVVSNVENFGPFADDFAEVIVDSDIKLSVFFAINFQYAQLDGIIAASKSSYFNTGANCGVHCRFKMPVGLETLTVRKIVAAVRNQKEW